MGDKKKRGESGQANAANITFRKGGSKCNLSTKTGSSSHHSGSTFLRGMLGGSAAAALGFPATITERMARFGDKAMERCTHPLIT